MRALPAPSKPVARSAAAQNTTQSPSSQTVQRRGSTRGNDGKWLAEYQDWQSWARRYARQIGAASFTGSVIADCCGRCDIRVEQRVDGEWLPTDDPRFVDIMDAYQNPLQMSDELIRLHAWHYQIAGEMLQTQRDGSFGVEYGIYSCAAAEWDKPDPGDVTIKLIPDGRIDRETAFKVPRAQTVRFWVPDHEWQAYAWSPMAASIDDLKRYRALARYVLRTADSALAMDGLLWIAGEVFEGPPPETDEPEQADIAAAKNIMEQAYWDAARLRLNEEDDVSAVAPHLVHWPKEFGEPKWVQMGKGLDPEGIAHRKEALEDFARSSSMPVTTVIGGGVGDANHWSEWLASDKFFDSGVAPTMDRICHLDLTRTFLWPRAKLAGFNDAQLLDIRIGYDPSPVIVKADKSNVALQLNRAGLLGNIPTLEAAGFDEAQQMQPGPEQDWLLKVLGGGAAGPPGAPGGSTPGVPGMPATPKSITHEPPTRPGLSAAAEFDEEAHPRDEHGRFGSKGGGDEEPTMSKEAQQFLDDHPRLPGESDFDYAGRIVQGLPPEQQSDIIDATRERYEPVGFCAGGAERWCEEHGLDPPPDDILSMKADLAEADAVGRFFEATPDRSDDPEVQVAYEDFKRQNAEMYDYMTKPESEGGLGIDVQFTTRKDPYDSAEAQAADLRDNKRIVIESGLGGDHTLMTRQEYDQFRAVHDVFGHAAIGGGFDRHGEYEAWVMHSAMYTPPGRDAMSTEYHGVNSAMWSGGYGSPGTGKSILLPDEFNVPVYDREAKANKEALIVASRLMMNPVTMFGAANGQPEKSKKRVSKQNKVVIEALGLDAEWANTFRKSAWHYKNAGGKNYARNASVRRAYVEDQERDALGRFGRGGEIPDPGLGAASGTKDDPIRGIKSADEALRLIHEGKYVEMDPDLVGVALDRLQSIAKEAEAKGEKAPVYDLCRITNEDASMFCGSAIVETRAEMPQLSTDKPVPGSPADDMERNSRGEVDITGAFMEQLAQEGVKSTRAEVAAETLKASQNELNGVKVADLMDAIASGEEITGSIMVSSDNYVIDGHHRWAADVGLNYTGGSPLTMPVVRIDMPIQQVLERANDFAEEMGVPQAKVGSLRSRVAAVLFAALGGDRELVTVG